MKLSFKRLGLAGGALIAAACATLAVPATAGAEVHVVLPSQTDRLTMGDGTVVSVTRTGERAIINPSLGGTPLHRNAWVSGTYSVHTSKDAKKIKIQAGYVVGCQVNISGLTNSGNGNGSVPSTGTPTGAVGGGATISVGPGQAVNYYINDVESADDYGNQKHSPKVTYKSTDHARLGYTNETMQISGCAGYAQARSMAVVYVIASNAEQVLTFYGKPFSLG
ncbi:MspA family porin [Gordonia bronchialis]|uniref:MspA family porin n=1 Tax=Gordonia bronchialis TaxID=2054 RepID=UPI00242C2D9B|nr:MspA family porin [Gordonia bronchialis]